MINTNNDIIEISNYARCWDWEPEWIDVQKIYNQFPDSYSILTPFAYSYLEQLIRTTTSEYGERPFENDGSPKRYTVGYPLVELAIKENIHNPKYVKLLEKAKEFFNRVDVLYEGMRRNNVQHGIVHPDKWSKENFENLIHYIANISKYSRF